MGAYLNDGRTREGRAMPKEEMKYGRLCEFYSVFLHQMQTWARGCVSAEFCRRHISIAPSSANKHRWTVERLRPKEAGAFVTRTVTILEGGE